MIKKISIAFFSLALLVFIGAGCQQQNQLNQNQNSFQNVLEVNDEGVTEVNSKNMQSGLDFVAKEELSEAEKNGLLFMREEEKLAHDVYQVLYEKWGQKIFANIAKSELTHTEAVKTLIERYDLTDPVTSYEIGKFVNTDLQDLYNDLVEKGSVTIEAALEVGATVEEVDIVDLEKYLKEVDNEDIEIVYNNLLRGSRNHLRAFVKNIEQNGNVYLNQYLSSGEFDDILDTEVERGGVGSARGSGNGNRGGK